MDALFISLLPFIIGSALVPIQIILAILLLKNPQQGLLKAAAYAGGMDHDASVARFGIWSGPDR